MREVFYGVISQGVTPSFYMNEKKCSFFGHREINITKQLYSATMLEIVRAIESGCRTFYFGGYGDFDTLCHSIVTKIAKENPSLNIKRIYCVTQERNLRKCTSYIKQNDYDEIIYLEPSFDGWYKSIYFRNCAIMDDSDIIIFYAQDKASSGAFKALKYAKKKKTS